MRKSERLAKETRSAILSILLFLFVLFRVTNAVTGIAEKATRRAFVALGRSLAKQREVSRLFSKYSEPQPVETDTDNFRRQLAELLSDRRYISAKTIAENLCLPPNQARVVTEQLDKLKITTVSADRSLGREITTRSVTEILRRLESGFVYRTVGERLNASRNAVLTRDIQIRINNSLTTYKQGTPIDTFQELLQERLDSLLSQPTPNKTKTHTEAVHTGNREE
jgi:hypothetical protein